MLDMGSQSNQRSKVKFDPKSGNNHLYWPIICGSLPTYSRMSGFTRMGR